MTQVHSVLVRAGQEPCAVLGRRAAPWLRPYVAGYSAFRAGAGAVAGRRVLPLALVTVIVDFAAPGVLVTGARETAMVAGQEGDWRCGMSVGLTPAGVRALLGLPMRELTGGFIPLATLVGSQADEMAGRLAAAPGWAARFAVLDELLTGWLRPGRQADRLTMHGWQRLQQAGGRVAIGGLAAELNISRRRLESGFAREIGLTPKTVARVARFQQALQVLATPPGTFSAAAACGYADQPHFNREIRAMAGITPSELRASVQYTARLPG
jgi:AraC-like DNA-binding protein